MIENHVKAATCEISCGDELGTGFLVTDKLILTARHCVLEAIEKGTVINLDFPSIGDKLSATVVDDDSALDICLLSVINPLEINPIELTSSLPREGNDWYLFGYPESKSIGHRVSGTISQLLDCLKLKMDIDLSIEPSTALDSYNGLSGSAMICDGAVCGLIKLKLEGSLGSISIHQFTDFLTTHNVSIHQEVNEQITEETGSFLAERKEFQLEFEALLTSSTGKYIFLEGAHGIGKTTFCNEFNPEDSSLLILGSYSFSSQNRGPGIAHQIQADVFFDWLSTSVSVLISGKSSRKEEKPYSVLITETEHFLRFFSDYCTEKKSQGVIFIDGLNEAMTVGKELFNKLIGLLPLELPSGITIVFTAPNQGNIASSLEGRVHSSIALPSLSDDTVKRYCWQQIQEDRATSALISRICQKTQGHPLYLRYLIEYVNNEFSDNELDDFPVFTGSIRTYYEQLWTKLLEDKEAINLLAIISRLRWGVPTDYLPKILTSTEQNVFIPTFSRIRHLLLNPDETSIYHASFTDFLISKTSQLDTTIEKRLATFCTTETELSYCTLNSIYHLLRSDEVDATQAVIHCTQDWVDQCVTLGVKPDTLLFDIEEILGFAVHHCSINEIVRILLLSQRINFRYNTLFTQSAQLAAKALIALKRPKDALQHAIRFNALFIHPDEIFQISYSLIQGGNTKEALRLLTLLEDQIIEAQSVKNLTIGDFILYRQIQIRCLFFMELADNKNRSEHILSTVINTIQVIRDSTKSSPEELIQIAEDIQCVPPSLQLYFYNRYTSLATLRKRFSNKLPPNIFDLLLGALHQYLRLQSEFRLAKQPTVLDEIFADIEELLSSGTSIDPHKVYSLINILIQLNAPSSLIESLASHGNGISPTQLHIKAENEVDVDSKEIYQKGNKWKVAAFLDADLDLPVLSEWSEKEWLQSLEQVFQAVFLCEGKACRGKVDNNTVLQDQVLDYLQTTILASLHFSLAQRVEWEDSYAIPEKILPLIYGQLAELYRDYYPQELLSFLQHISNQIKLQCGVYSEGFREILSVVLHQIIDTDREISDDVSDEAFNLLQQWKDYILRNVENRHELVPEILQLIPLFVRIDAEEIAKELYQKMLDVSMGPSWYKEAQLGILVSSLRSIPKSSNVNSLLPQIAGYLERSSGEMTFQRYVRHEKMLLIGELFKRGKSYQACEYFKRQVCGTLAELYSEACDGDMDRVSKMKGMRYPGGALDEQESILQIICNVEQVDWRLSWALLEIYQYGDTRHLSSYAKQYATLVNTIDIESPEISVAIARMKLVIGSELSLGQHIEFLEAFQDKLDSTHLPLFTDILKPLSEQNTVSEKITPKGENNADDRDDDAFYMPGTFGKHSSSKEADEVLAKAEKKLARGNIEAAKQLSIEVLQILQQGGWSIWGNLSYTAHRAEDILLEDVNTADEVIQFYAPLLRDERYDARWILADHLIGRIAKILDEKESNLLVQSAIDHIELIVGDSTDQIKAFSFLEGEQENDVSLDLLELIFWLIDHPQKIRSDKAANMLAWLLQQNNTYYEHCVKQAFSMDTGYSADVICGIFDGLSTQNPLQLWDQISPFLNSEMILQDCQHIGRLSVLYRITDRASQVGATGSSDISQLVIDQFHPDSGESSNTDISKPAWVHCLGKEWESLKNIKMLSSEFVKHFEEEMKKVCLPFDIETTWNLEKMVSKGFQSKVNATLNRWEAKVRFVLNVTLFKYTTQQTFFAIDDILRIYNPSSLIVTRTTNHISLANSIIETLAKDPKNITGDRESFFLNYQEMTINQNGDGFFRIEITAVVISQFSGYRPNSPTDASLFSSRQLPNTENKLQGFETCYSVDPDIAFLDTFTPAIPTDSFKRLINALDSDFVRKNWKNGKYERFGSPMSEGCLLAVKRNALHLKSGWGLAWIFRINGQTVNIISKRW